MTTRIKEADLARHLEGESENKGNDKGADAAKDSKAKLPLARRDYAVYEALNLLKGLSILQKQHS